MSISLLLSMEKKISTLTDIKDIEIVTSDGKQDTIPQKYLRICKIIDNALEDIPNNGSPIPLPITAEMLPTLKYCLKNSYILENNQMTSFTQKIAKMDLEIQLNTQYKLHSILSFANQMESSTLLKYCIILWANKKYVPTKTYNLPHELNVSIAQQMNGLQLLINNTATWTVEDLTKLKIKLLKDTLLSRYQVWSTAISKNGTLIASGNAEGTISIYNYRTNEFEDIQSNHHVCSTLQFDGLNNQIWSSGQDGTIKIWDLVTKKNIKTFNSPDCYAFVFQYIPQQKILIADSKNYKLCFWDLDKNSYALLDAHTRNITALNSPHDNSLLCVSASHDGYVYVWDIISKKPRTFFSHDTSVLSTNLNYEENKLICGLAGGKIILYDLSTATKLYDTQEHFEDIWCVLSTDKSDTLFCSGSKDQTIKLWDPRTYKSIKTLHSHYGCVHHISKNDQTNLMASASCDKTVKIWDLRKLLLPICSLRDEFSKNCTIEDMIMFEKATTLKNPLKKNNPLLKNLLAKLSPNTQKFLLYNSKALHF